VPPAALVSLDQPSGSLHWSIFTVSVANLIVIAVMVVSFDPALILPFPRQADETATGGERASSTGPDDGTDASLWPARLRQRTLALLPPGKLLPDRQPAYVVHAATTQGTSIGSISGRLDRPRSSRFPDDLE